jgi:hypothetical protein
MSARDDGGPAFPVNTANDGNGGACFPATGMSLRDYFAGEAMAALISRPDKDPQHRGILAVPKMTQYAYEYADAMIAERAK